MDGADAFACAWRVKRIEVLTIADFLPLMTRFGLKIVLIFF